MYTHTHEISSLISFELSFIVLSFFFDVHLFLAVSLLNGATVIVAPVDILSLVSVGHVVENARLVDVDGGAMVV